MVSYLEEGREEGGRLLLKNWCLTTGSASVKLVGIIEIGAVAMQPIVPYLTKRYPKFNSCIEMPECQIATPTRLLPMKPHWVYNGDNGPVKYKEV
jgi:hypothetical protein